MGVPRSILLIRPSALGDVCRTVPVLASLRAAYPEARIDWLVQDSFAPAVSHHPALSNAVAFPRTTVALHRLWRPTALRALRDMLRSLRAARYDLMIDCQGLGRSGLFALWTGAARRVGFADAREMGWLGLTERHAVPAGMHTVDRMLALVERAGITPVRDMRLYTSPEGRAEASSLLPTGERCAVLAPTSRWPGKRWPAERFAALARAILDARAADRVALIGSPGERDQCPELVQLAAKEPRVTDLIGRTSIHGLMALIERAAIVIANDSAALHMAVGFDRPLLGLFGPTRTDLVGPYRREQDVVRAADPGPRNLHKDEAHGRRAMNAIALDSVVDAALTRLRAAPSPAPDPAAHRS